MKCLKLIKKEEEININNEKILELEKELRSYLQKVEQVENNLLKIQNDNIQMKKGLNEIKSFPLSNSNNTNTNKYEVYFILKSSSIISLIIKNLKRN